MPTNQPAIACEGPPTRVLQQSERIAITRRAWADFVAEPFTAYFNLSPFGDDEADAFYMAKLRSFATAAGISEALLEPLQDASTGVEAATCLENEACHLADNWLNSLSAQPA